MIKKIFAISTFLLILVIGAIFVYNFLFKAPASQKNKTDTTQTTEEGKLSEKNSEPPKTETGVSIQPILDEPVFGATFSPDGKYIYAFLAENGQLNQYDLSGKLDKVLSTEKFDNIKKIVWNKPRNKVIIKTEPSPDNVKFFYFDISEKKVSVLKENIDSVSWSNLGDKIMYKYYDSKTKKGTINVANPDGKNWQIVAEISYRDAEIAPIPNSSDISFWPSPNAFTATSVASAAFSGENKKELLKDRYGVNLLWSPNGTQAILSATDEKGGHKTDLLLMNRQGGEIHSLMFPTFASKCAWASDSKTLYCALPGNISDLAILPNDWQEGKFTTSDTFWKIDTSTGKKERLVDPEKIGGSYDALNPFLSSDEKILFFTNKDDWKLYKLSL
jgi:hypothetical protein